MALENLFARNLRIRGMNLVLRIGISVFGLLLLLTLASPVFGQTREVLQTGVNAITVTTYNPRDLADGKLPVSMLKEDWNTEQEVRWDLTAVFALLAEQSWQLRHSPQPIAGLVVEPR